MRDSFFLQAWIVFWSEALFSTNCHRHDRFYEKDSTFWRIVALTFVPFNNDHQQRLLQRAFLLQITSNRLAQMSCQKNLTKNMRSWKLDIISWRFFRHFWRYWIQVNTIINIRYAIRRVNNIELKLFINVKIVKMSIKHLGRTIDMSVTSNCIAFWSKIEHSLNQFVPVHIKNIL